IFSRGVILSEAVFQAERRIWRGPKRSRLTQDSLTLRADPRSNLLPQHHPPDVPVLVQVEDDDRQVIVLAQADGGGVRSEERRVGKECRSRGARSEEHREG